MAGSAGALLGLLALHAVTGDAAILDRATLCGSHLLECRDGDGNGARAWTTMDERRLTGFSHGAAGIAYALSRLYAATSGEAFLAAAAEGIAYEGSVFCPAAGNWPDLRPRADGGEPSEPAFIAQWCHGAAGIGLGRLGGLTVLDSSAVRRDLEVALATTLDCDWHGVDHLCCGNLGRIELLLEAGPGAARARSHRRRTDDGCAEPSGTGGRIPPPRRADRERLQSDPVSWNGRHRLSTAPVHGAVRGAVGAALGMTQKTV